MAVLVVGVVVMYVPVSVVVAHLKLLDALYLLLVWQKRHSVKEMNNSRWVGDGQSYGGGRCPVGRPAPEDEPDSGGWVSRVAKTEHRWFRRWR
jgi:hypothetical protein